MHQNNFNSSNSELIRGLIIPIWVLRLMSVAFSFMGTYQVLEQPLKVLNVPEPIAIAISFGFGVALAFIIEYGFAKTVPTFVRETLKIIINFGKDNKYEVNRFNMILVSVITIPFLVANPITSFLGGTGKCSEIVAENTINTADYSTIKSERSSAIKAAKSEYNQEYNRLYRLNQHRFDAVEQKYQAKIKESEANIKRYEQYESTGKVYARAKAQERTKIAGYKKQLSEEKSNLTKKYINGDMESANTKLARKTEQAEKEYLDAQKIIDSNLSTGNGHIMTVNSFISNIGSWMPLACVGLLFLFTIYIEFFRLKTGQESQAKPYYFGKEENKVIGRFRIKISERLIELNETLASVFSTFFSIFVSLFGWFQTAFRLIAFLLDQPNRLVRGLVGMESPKAIADNVGHYLKMKDQLVTSVLASHKAGNKIKIAIAKAEQEAAVNMEMPDIKVKESDKKVLSIVSPVKMPDTKPAPIPTPDPEAITLKAIGGVAKNVDSPNKIVYNIEIQNDIAKIYGFSDSPITGDKKKLQNSLGTYRSRLKKAIEANDLAKKKAHETRIKAINEAVSKLKELQLNNEN